MATKFSATETATMVPLIGDPTRLETLGLALGWIDPAREWLPEPPALAKMVREAATIPAASTPRAAMTRMITSPNPTSRRILRAGLLLAALARRRGFRAARRPSGT